VIVNEYLTLSEASELIGKSKETLRRWDREGRLSAVREPISNYRVYNKAEVLTLFSDFLVKDTKDTTSNYVEAENDYKVLELFAGAGGLAVGFERAGLNCVALNDIDKWACQTLCKNRSDWNVLEGDIRDFYFSECLDSVYVVAGGFPCQAYSYDRKIGFSRCQKNTY
jgi:DNA (cytosine-5)-methyltransferase 1